MSPGPGTPVRLPRGKGLVGYRQRVAAGVTLAVGLVAVAVAWAAGGRTDGLSALLGVVLVLVFTSAAAIPLTLADLPAGRGFLGFVILGLNYTLRLVLALVVWRVVRRQGSLDGRVIGLCVVVCALVWVTCHVVFGLSRRHQPLLDVTAVPGDGPTGESGGEAQITPETGSDGDPGARNTHETR